MEISLTYLVITLLIVFDLCFGEEVFLMHGLHVENTA